MEVLPRSRAADPAPLSEPCQGRWRAGPGRPRQVDPPSAPDATAKPRGPRDAGRRGGPSSGTMRDGRPARARLRGAANAVRRVRRPVPLALAIAFVQVVLVVGLVSPCSTSRVGAAERCRGGAQRARGRRAARSRELRGDEIDLLPVAATLGMACPGGLRPPDCAAGWSPRCRRVDYRHADIVTALPSWVSTAPRGRRTMDRPLSSCGRGEWGRAGGHDCRAAVLSWLTAAAARRCRGGRRRRRATDLLSGLAAGVALGARGRHPRAAGFDGGAIRDVRHRGQAGGARVASRGACAAARRHCGAGGVRPESNAGAVMRRLLIVLLVLAALLLAVDRGASTSRVGRPPTGLSVPRWSASPTSTWAASVPHPGARARVRRRGRDACPPSRRRVCR